MRPGSVISKYVIPNERTGIGVKSALSVLVVDRSGCSSEFLPCQTRMVSESASGVGICCIRAERIRETSPHLRIVGRTSDLSGRVGAAWMVGAQSRAVVSGPQCPGRPAMLNEILICAVVRLSFWLSGMAPAWRCVPVLRPGHGALSRDWFQEGPVSIGAPAPGTLQHRRYWQALV